MKSKITVHTLVKNEEHYLWYSVASVISYVEKLLLWDTGSSDSTNQIIQELKARWPEKISFRQYGDVTPETFTCARQEMLEETESDWIMIVDGDEVWWDASVKEVVDTVEKEGHDLDSLVNSYVNVVGDIFHHQDEVAGKYTIDGKTGHHTIRIVNKNLTGLRFDGLYGYEGFWVNEKKLQDLSESRRKHLSEKFLHFTHVERSSADVWDNKVIQRSKKYKFDTGRVFPRDFYYPEVFFREKPTNVFSPWKSRKADYIARAKLEFPLKLIKRKYLKF